MISSKRQHYIDQHLEQCDGCIEKLCESDDSADSFISALRTSPPELLDDAKLQLLLDCGKQVKRQNDGALDETLGNLDAESTQAPGESRELSTSVRRGGAQQKFPDVPGFEIVSELGKGGMGVVYEAQQLGLNRKVALKMILPRGVDDDDAIKRFRVEAESVARLEHPNIVRIHEVGEANGSPYFSLEYVAGGSLRQLMKSESVSSDSAADLIAKIAAGIEYAHQRGVVHRDLKPANVLLGENLSDDAESGSQSSSRNTQSSTTGSQDSSLIALGLAPKIADFGLARLTDVEDQRQTRTGAVMGTPTYMAPEQAAGRIHDCGPPVDIYALGVMLYELLTGRVPFRAESVVEMLQLVQETSPIAPSRLQPGLHRDLEIICLKCLEKEPEKRYGTAGELRADLRRFLRDEPIVARPVGPLERTYRWAKRKPVLASLIAVVSLLTIAMIVVPTSLVVQLNESNKDLSAATETAIGERNYSRLKESEAKENEAIAVSERIKSDRRYVASVISLADDSLGSGQTPRAVQLLESVRPKFDEPDYRSFDWYELFQRCFTGQSEFKSHDSSVVDTEFCATKNRLYTISFRGVLKVWDAQSNECVHEINLKENLRCLAVSDDGQRIVCGCVDSVVVELHWVDGQWSKMHRFRLDGAPIFAVDFVPGTHRYLVSDQLGPTIRDIDDGEIVRSFPARKSAIIYQAVASDSVFVTTNVRAETYLWRKRTEWTQEYLTAKDGSKAKAVAFDSDGSHLAVAYENVLAVYRVSDAKTVHQREIASDQVLSIAFGSSDKVIHYISQDNSLRSWDFEKDIESVSAARSTVHSMACAPELGVAFVGLENGNVCRWGLNDQVRQVTQEMLQAKSRLISCDVSADSKYLVVGREFGSIVIYDLQQQRALVNVAVRLGDSSNLDFSRDNRRIAIGWDTGTTSIKDADREWKTITREWGSRRILASAFSPDGNLVATINGKSCRMLDLRSESRDHWVTSARGHALDFSPDGKHLAAADNNQVVIWDVERRREVNRLMNQQGPPLQTILFSPDGKRLAVADQEGSITLWNTVNWEMQGVLRGHAGNIFDLAFYANGEYLVSLGSDRTIRFWDVVIHQERCSWQVDKPAEAFALAELDGAPTLIVAFRDGELRRLVAANDHRSKSYSDELDSSDLTSPVATSIRGKQYLVDGMAEKAAAEFQVSRDRLEKLAARFPDVTQYKYFLADAHLGLAHASLQDRETNLRRAFELSRDAFETDPHRWNYQELAARALRDLATFHDVQGYSEKAKELLSEFCAVPYQSSGLLAQAAILLASTRDAGEHEFRNSLQSAQRAIKTAPEGQFEKLALGVALYYSGRFEDAYAELVSWNPSDEVARVHWHFMALACAKLGKQEAAGMWLRRASSQPTEGIALNGIGAREETLADLRRQVVKAIDKRWLEPIDSIEEARWWYEQGGKFKNDQPRISVDYFRRSIEIHSESVDCFRAGADAMIANEDWYVARDWLETATEKYSEDAGLWKLFGNVFEKLPLQDRQASNAYRKAAQLENSEELWSKAAELDERAYNLLGAKDAYAKVIELNPGNAHAIAEYLRLNEAVVAQDKTMAFRYQKELADLMLKLYQSGNLSEKYAQTAQGIIAERASYLLYQQRNPKLLPQAKPFYDELLEIAKKKFRADPAYAESYNAQLGWNNLHYANLYRRIGNPQQSLEHLFESVRLFREGIEQKDPDLQRVGGLVVILSLMEAPERYPEFRELGRLAAKTFPNNGGLQNAVGVCYGYEQDWESAIKAFSTAEQLGFRQTDYFLKGMAHLRLGNLSEAEKAIERGNQVWEELLEWRNEGRNQWHSAVLLDRRNDVLEARQRLEKNRNTDLNEFTIPRGADGKLLEVSRDDIEALKIWLSVACKENKESQMHEVFLCLQELGELPSHLRWQALPVLSRRGMYFLYGNSDPAAQGKAEPFFQARIDLLENIKQSEPDRENYCDGQAARCYFQLTSLHANLGNEARTEQFATKSVAIFDSALSSLDETDRRFESMIAILSYGVDGQRNKVFEEFTAKAAKMYLDNGAIQNMYGVSLAGLGDWNAAIDAFERAEKLAYPRTDWFLKSIAYAELEDRENATKALDRGVKAWDAMDQWRTNHPWESGQIAARRKRAVEKLSGSNVQ